MEYESLFKAARKAGTALADVEPERLGRILQHAARLLRGHTPALLEANTRDIEAMPASSPMLDRLRLTPGANRLHRLRHGSRIAPALASGRGTGALDAPQRHDHRQAPRTVRRGRHGLRSPPQCHGRHLRPLRQDGQRLRPERGQRRRHSNEAIAALLHEALGAEGIDENTFTLLPAGHEAVGALLGAVGYVDVVIPRGGRG